MKTRLVHALSVAAMTAALCAPLAARSDDNSPANHNQQETQNCTLVDSLLNWVGIGGDCGSTPPPPPNPAAGPGNCGPTGGC